MSVLQTITLSQDTIKTRWREPYVTAGLNQKALAGDTRGVVMGFKVVPSSGYSIEIQADPTLGLSIANVLDTATLAYSLTLVQVGSLYLDLTAQAGTTVFIALDAQYSVGENSGAQLRVVDAAELLLNTDLVVLAKVNVPATPIPGPPVTAADINTGYRTNAGDNVPVATIPPTNLVQNPGFETGTTSGWYSDGTWTTFATTASASYEGNYALQLSRAGVGSSAATSAPMPVAVGLKYRVRGRFRTAAGLTGIGARLQVGWFDGADAQIGGWVNVEDVVLAATVSPPFTLRQSEVTAPDYAINARLRIFFDACSGFMYADDFRFLTTEPMLQRTAVFAGPGFIADAFHSHSAGGGFYSGSVPPPAPFSGWSLPAGSLEATFDQIVADLGASSGATRIGNALSKILNNVLVNSVPNTASIDATGNGAAAAIIGRGSSTINMPGGLFISNAATTGPGSQSVGSGTGPGVEGFGGLSNNSYGGYFTSNSTIGNGLRGQAVASGVGVEGIGGVNDTDFGSNVLNPPTRGPGTGGVFMGATGLAGGDGIQAWGRSTNNSRTGVLGVGAFPTVATVAGGSGLYGFGGTGGGGDSNGGNGVIGVAGARTGAGTQGSGVYGSANGLPFAFGVRGLGATAGAGVYGKALGAFSIGVKGEADALNNTSGVVGLGVTGFNTTGVSGTGGGLSAGGFFTGGELGATGVLGTGGATSGVGVTGNGGSPNGRGVEAIGAGTGAGLAARSSAAAFGSIPTNTGLYAIGTNMGARITGSGSGLGAMISGGVTDGPGMEVFAVGTGLPLEAYMGDGNNAADIIRCAGWQHYSGANPVSTTGFSNRQTGKNICKAWVLFRCNNTATCTLVDGFNVASVTVFGSVIDVNFVNPAGLMGNANYSVVASAESFFPNAWIAIPGPGGSLAPNSAFSAKITLKQSNNNSLIDAAGASVNGLGIFVQVFGAQ